MKYVKFNTTAGNYSHNDVMVAAWSIYATAVRNGYREIKISLDQRYNFNREAEQAAREIAALKGWRGLEADQAKNRARHAAKRDNEQPANVLSSPLVKDYQTSRRHLNRVCADHLDFSGRNHWAKSERDLKILAILARAFARYQATR